MNWLQIRRIVLACGVAATGLWVGRLSIAPNAAKQDPASALSFDPRNALVGGARARQFLEAGDIGSAVPLAIRALQRDATVVPAVQVIGLAAQASGDTARAGRVLGYADRLSRRDLQTHLWAIEHYVARNDVPSALKEYDFALRTSPAARDVLFPVLGAAIADPAIGSGLIRRLAAKPIWASDFLTYIASEGSVPPASALRFLRAARSLRVRSGPLGVLVGRALAADQPEIAWQAYALQRPTARRSEIRDPSFRDLSEQPAAFDWNLSNDGSIAAQALTRDGGSVLEIEAGSGATGTAAEQVQMLPPGRYRLTVEAEAITTGASAAIRVQCRSGAELVKLTLTGTGAERRVSEPFGVASSCPVQVAIVAVDASESPEGLHTALKRVAISVAGS